MSPHARAARSSHDERLSALDLDRAPLTIAWEITRACADACALRSADPVAIYRRSPLFRSLRDPSALKGKCGRCEFREVCGGSRARAYAVMGDHLASDPSCPYVPREALAASG